jgi:hypothetical protein
MRSRHAELRDDKKRGAMSVTASVALSHRTALPVRVGLVMGALLAVADMVFWAAQFADGPLLPISFIVVSLVSLVATPFAWRGAPWARLTVITTRILAALSAVPAFFFPSAPAGAVVAAGVGIGLQALVVVLLLIGPRSAR